MKADVLVVGAGPSGAAAASLLSQKGLRVVLIDRAKFPREKVCGDAISPRSLQVLQEIGLGEWLHTRYFEQPRSLRIYAPSGHYAEIEAPKDVGLGMVIPRIELDHAVLKNAICKGVVFVEETEAVGALQIDHCIEVKCLRKGSIFTAVAQIVLACDGSVASFSRSVGLVRREPDAFAARVYVEGTESNVTSFNAFYLEEVLPGYGWVFPVGGGIYNVGLGMQFADIKNGKLGLRTRLINFLNSKVVEQLIGHIKMLGPIKGYPLRTLWVGRTRLCTNRIIVLGDAATLVHPLIGEGIAPALESAVLAAEHTLLAFERGDFSERSLSSYAAAIRTRYAYEYLVALLLRKQLKAPWMANKVVELARTQPKFANLIREAYISLAARKLLTLSTFAKAFFYWPLEALLLDERT